MGGDYGDVYIKEFFFVEIGSIGFFLGSGCSNEGFFFQVGVDIIGWEVVEVQLDEDGDLDVVRRL